MLGEAKGSDGFLAWLHERAIQILFSVFGQGGVVSVRSPEPGQLNLTQARFRRPMGLHYVEDAGILLVADQAQVWQLSRWVGRDGPLLVPTRSWVTGRVDPHDVVWSGAGPMLAATKFNAIVGVSDEGQSFEPQWCPPFIGAMDPEDRCHLNGLAVRDGQVEWATVCSQENRRESWRGKKDGAVIHVPSSQVVVGGLSMPHSPRWSGKRLWLLESEAGALGYVDGDRFEKVAGLPGYPRGMVLVDGFAVIGVSQFRHQKREGQGGLVVVDLHSGEVAHSLSFAGENLEVFDVAAIRTSTGVKVVGADPMEVGFQVQWSHEVGPVNATGRGSRSPCDQLHARPVKNLTTGALQQFGELVEQRFWREAGPGRNPGRLVGAAVYSGDDVVALTIGAVRGDKLFVLSEKQAVPCDRAPKMLRGVLELEVKRILEG